eukprot:TRINITY_DN365_c0_g1_i1.p1 TRINITY_DN365_c0_g1~~TRINITY_DN365_c0_g1_i1.p1  ORF type:complete len:242 (-),score=45.72 TRINITY_DN365_c0_g1_i1:320-1045(-)
MAAMAAVGSCAGAVSWTPALDKGCGSFQASRNSFLSGAHHLPTACSTSQRTVLPTPAIVCKESRIGKAPIPIPKGVTVTLKDKSLEAKGPLGLLTREYPREVRLEKEGEMVSVFRTDETRRSRQMHGLFRTLTANMINGVSTGFKKDLELIGVGYRASVAGQTLTMNLGFSHPVVMEIPEGINVKVEGNTRMNVSGRDKELVGQFAASVRRWRPPEPYKGKGIKFQGEVIRRKAGKAGKKK